MNKQQHVIAAAFDFLVYVYYIGNLLVVFSLFNGFINWKKYQDEATTKIFFFFKHFSLCYFYSSLL